MNIQRNLIFYISPKHFLVKNYEDLNRSKQTNSKYHLAQNFIKIRERKYVGKSNKKFIFVLEVSILNIILNYYFNIYVPSPEFYERKTSDHRYY